MFTGFGRVSGVGAQIQDRQAAQTASEKEE